MNLAVIKKTQQPRVLYVRKSLMVKMANALFDMGDEWSESYRDKIEEHIC